MHTTTLLLACVACAWTTYARKTVSRSAHRNLRVSKSDFEEHLSPRDTFRPPSGVNFDPKVWEPPKYIESLKNFDNAVADVRNHLVYNKDLGTSADSNLNRNYITLVYVMNGLAVDLAQNGWESFDNNYANTVTSLVRSAEWYPRAAIDTVNCIFDAANKKIHGMRKLMESEWVAFLCTAKPSACDVLIHAVVKMSADKELDQEAELLLMLGKPSSDSVKSFTKEAFKWIDSVHLFLLHSKNSLRGLVSLNAIVQRGIFPRGDQCFGKRE